MRIASLRMSIVIRVDDLTGPGIAAFLEEHNRTHFDSRCTRFLRVDYQALAGRVLDGGSDEEILEWCFQHGYRPSDEEIEIWNGFMMKRGWRDAGSNELREEKRLLGFGDREDIQTWFDLHVAEEEHGSG